jgi:hypothetical protein
MSTIQLNSKDFASQTSSAEPVIASTVTFPGEQNSSGGGGHVLQVIQTVKTGTASRSGSHTDFADISGMSVAITPSVSSSKVLVLCSLQLGQYTASAMAVKMVRGSTDIFIGDAAGSTIRASGDFRAYSEYNQNSMVLNYLDSPSTTSATTYKLQWHNLYDGSTMYLNSPNNQTDTSDRARTASSIIVMEIAG